MNDKDRKAFEMWFNTRGGIAQPQFYYREYLFSAWKACLDYARKENKELLEKCNSVLGMVHHINDVNDESVIEITANAKELILELNTAGIGKE